MILQKPSVSRDKGWEKGRRSRGGGGGALKIEGETEGMGAHFSSTASHPVHVTMEDLAKKKRKKKPQLCPAATARRGMFLGGLNLDPACCTINPD